MIPSWLEPETSAYVKNIIDALASRHADLIQSIILYGSIARHDERPIDDPHPNYVDLLVVWKSNERDDTAESLVNATLSEAFHRHLDAPREVNILYGTPSMRTWDPMFPENVIRDGIPLYGPMLDPAKIESTAPDLAELLADLPDLLKRSEEAAKEWERRVGLADKD